MAQENDPLGLLAPKQENDPLGLLIPAQKAESVKKKRTYKWRRRSFSKRISDSIRAFIREWSKG